MSNCPDEQLSGEHLSHNQVNHVVWMRRIVFGWSPSLHGEMSSAQVDGDCYFTEENVPVESTQCDEVIGAFHDICTDDQSSASPPPVNQPVGDQSI